VAQLRAYEIDYLWFNARRVAYDFYASLGALFISGEFEMPGIGPHRRMVYRISK
jgi:hypothetical protein